MCVCSSFLPLDIAEEKTRASPSVFFCPRAASLNGSLVRWLTPPYAQCGIDPAHVQKRPNLFREEFDSHQSKRTELQNLTSKLKSRRRRHFHSQKCQISSCLVFNSPETWFWINANIKWIKKTNKKGQKKKKPSICFYWKCFTSAWHNILIFRSQYNTTAIWCAS